MIETDVTKKWDVVGSKGDNYTIELKEGNWSCTCKAYTYSKETPPICKHIKKVIEETKA